ncbi:MAG TPA: hypothetical protein EYH45_03105 [Candidatus Caldiarchaeum subterraneum]|uniref:Uncharacterized protein n=1 Tax=Caldiarchaeum subterraneum TaxID=311458 RepID=A0A832ZVC2_CALS0|nr:hypothetical protein [Candidatus Caldarchaeum subterraneum]
MRAMLFLILLFALAGAALSTVLFIQQVGEAGAGDSGVSRGGYIREARLVSNSRVRVVFISQYSGTARVVVNVNGVSGVATATVSPGANVIYVTLSGTVSASTVNIAVSVNRVF